MKITKNNPQRIRSKMILAIYKTSFNLESDKVLETFRQACRVNSDHDWKYILKSEKCVDGDNIIQLYIELAQKSDFFCQKVVIEIQAEDSLTPWVWCMTESSLVLFMFLKEYSTLNTKRSLLTNVSLDELNSYSVKMDEQYEQQIESGQANEPHLVGETYESISAEEEIQEFTTNSIKKEAQESEEEIQESTTNSIKKAAQKSADNKKDFTDKQIKRLEEYFEKFSKIEQKPVVSSEDIVQLEQVKRNVTNYIYNYNCSPDLLEKIDSFKPRLKAAKERVSE